jgi:putative protein-disulfide isomerase
MVPTEHLNDTPELIYLQDSLCGWCYGMSPVIQQLRQRYTGRVQLSVLCGGMATGAEVQAAANWEHWGPALALMTQVTGVSCGPAFEQLRAAGTYRCDSEPPSQAIVAFRQLSADPARTVDFAHAVQQQLFQQGRNLNDSATYDALVAAAGVDVAAFHHLLDQPSLAQATRQEFAAVARLGVQGFPTTILRVGQQGYVLARGYQPLEQLQASLEQLLQETGH